MVTILPAAAALIAGGIGAVGGIASGIIDSRISRKNIAAQIRARKEMAEYGYAKDLEMWKRQNIYNMPSSQMARLKQAGLNPNLVYGTGTVTGNVQGQMPKYNQPQLDYEYKPPQLAQNLQQFSSFAMQQAQTKNIDADTIKKLVEANVATDTEMAQKHLIWGGAKQKLDQAAISGYQRIQWAEKSPWFRKTAAAELRRSQAGAAKSEQDAILKKMEVELYNIIKKVGIGSTAGRAASTILRSIYFKR